MNKKEFVELALRAFNPEVVDPKAYFENLYDQTFKEIEERIDCNARLFSHEKILFADSGPNGPS